MVISLRDYQVKLIKDIYDGWSAGHRNVLAVSPTGSGKAFTLCTLAKELAYVHRMETTIKVHRKELVSQLCMSLAQLGVYHNIIAQKDTILEIMEQQRREYGTHYYQPNSPITVVSVDTILSRKEKYKEWGERQKVWILDEAAHQLKGNKWGKATELMPNAIGVGFTATPQRLDKKGLGRHAFGLFDVMVTGPTVRYLIDHGFLSRYKVVVPPSQYREYLKEDNNDKTDYTHEAREYASIHSGITGDVVDNYIKFINGKQAIIFADSLKAGMLMEANFKDKGIVAKLLAGDTPPKERLQGVNDYRCGLVKVLINVDLFDEGFDVPGTDAVVMARPTKSLGKYLQMCGRSLRVAKGKEHAVLIDHVGNIKYHDLPDKVRRWTLDNIIRKRERVDLIRTCVNTACNLPFDRALVACPYCGCADQKPSRSGGERSPTEELEMVDGDLELLDPETIRALEKNIDLEDPDAIAERVARAAGPAAGKSARKKQVERIEMQKVLAQTIAEWAGYQKETNGYSDRSIKKKFYNVFGETITVALSLTRAEMEEMCEDIRSKMWL
jgi:superfamily II DNA or RNA helicase